MRAKEVILILSKDAEAEVCKECYHPLKPDEYGGKLYCSNLSCSVDIMMKSALDED